MGNVALKDSLAIQNFSFNADIHPAKRPVAYFVKDFIRPDLLHIDGNFDSEKDSLKLNINANEFEYKGKVLDSLSFALSTNKSNSFLTLGVDSLHLNDSLSFDPAMLIAEIKGDMVEFDISTDHILDIVSDLNLHGTVAPFADSLFQIKINPSDFYVYGKRWHILEKNKIRIGKQFISTKNLEISHKNEKISFRTYDNTGLEVSADNIPLDLLNPTLEKVKGAKLVLGSKLNAKLGFQNVFKQKGIVGGLVVSDIILNDMNWGDLVVNLKAPDLKNPLTAKISLDSRGDVIDINGKFTPGYATKDVAKKNSYNFEIKTESYPIKVAESFLGHMVSEVTGKASARLSVYGTPKVPNISGEVKAWDGAVKIDYLQTKYKLPRATVRVDNNQFDFSGSKLLDSFSNIALIKGGIMHDHLRKFRLDMDITSPRNFLLIDTQKEHNKQFYGKGIGKVTCKFRGKFNAVDIYVNATADKGTKFIIPLSGEQEVSAVNFIKFVDFDEHDEDAPPEVEAASAPTGISFEMDLSLTPNAEVQMIFDEQTGEILKGWGEGDMKIGYSREQQFTMFGDYRIEKGAYLFNYQNYINKPFTVKKGGSVSWSGSPYDAQLAVDAVYTKSTAPLNFILEYITTNDDRAMASNPTDVELLMKLSGSLLKPQIDFDLAFPNLSGLIGSYTDAKLRTLYANKNELNRQVFGLLLMGNFLPADPSLATNSNNSYYTGINTVSEMLSNQLSLYLTDLLSEMVSDGKYLSSIDFDIGYRMYQIENMGTDGDQISTARSEVQLGLNSNFFNNRLRVKIGGSLDVGNGEGSLIGTENTNYIGGDFIIEYSLTRDGRFKVKIYTEDETIIGGWRYKSGLGFSYSKEFDSLKELFSFK